MARAIGLLLLLLACNLALADETGERIAVRRSADIVEMIGKAEPLLKRAISYGDETGFRREVAGPMTRRLQWWREFEQEHHDEFAPYRSCLDAGVQFNLYSNALWERPSLSRDQHIQEGKREYPKAMRECKREIAERTRR